MVLVLFGVEFSVCSCGFAVLWFCCGVCCLGSRCVVFGWFMVWLLLCVEFPMVGLFTGDLRGFVVFILIVLVIWCGGSCVTSCWLDYGVCILCLRTC